MLDPQCFNKYTHDTDIDIVLKDSPWSDMALRLNRNLIAHNNTVFNYAETGDKAI
ncbi:hypothetical protein ES703_86768 [subsurface metagenome]